MKGRGAVKPNWFVGLPVVDSDWLDGLLEEVPGSTRRFHPADLHLTVAFLGPCSRESAQAGFAALDGLSHPAISATLGPARPLGNPRRPSAFSLTLREGRDEVASLMSAWREPVWAAAGAQRDQRPALPHITIAKPARRASDDARAAAEQWALALEVPPTPITLCSVALYTWSSDRRSQLFEIVARRNLCGSLE